MDEDEMMEVDVFVLVIFDCRTMVVFEKMIKNLRKSYWIIRLIIK